MLGLDAFTRKPRAFSYKPVYFDPAKEAREQRKRELFGVEAEPVEQTEEYVAGNYIRKYGFARKKTQITDRQIKVEYRERAMRRGIIALILLLFVAAYLIL